MKNLMMICLLYCCCFASQVQAQNDSTGCGVQVFIADSTDPNGITTFTAIYTGTSETSPYIEWWTSTGGYGLGASYSAQIPSAGMEVCVNVGVPDPSTEYDSCYTTHCTYFYGDTMQPGACNALVSYTYSNEPSGLTTFATQYSGVNNPAFTWYVNGVYSGNNANPGFYLASGSEVCVTLTDTESDSCFANFCDTIYADTMPQNGCNANVWFSYDPSATSSTPTTFTAGYSGVDNPYFQWFVNGVAVGTSSPTYTGVVADGIPVCVRLTGYNEVYDSLNQVISTDSTCYAQYCQTFQEDSVVGGNCNAYVSFTSVTGPTSVSTFTATYGGLTHPHLEWIINGNTVYYGNVFEGYVSPGSEVCLLLTGYNVHIDSLSQELQYDTCYVQYCETFYGDTIQPGGCNATLSYTQASDSTGFTTFAAQFSGVSNPILQWYINGAYVGSGASYTGNIAAGAEICVMLIDNNQSDSCYVQVCGTFYEDTLQENSPAVFSYSYNPMTGETTFTAEDVQKQQTEFTWLVNGVLMSHDPQFTAVVPEGAEVCLLVQTNEQSATAGGISCQFVSHETASLDEKEKVVYNLYPNPAGDKISISVSAGGKADLIAVTDMYGREVLTSTLLNNIDVSQLSSGVYYVRVLDAAGNSLWNESLIKQ